jgi:macrolide-specific efflux system membrane fusion protein
VSRSDQWTSEAFMTQSQKSGSRRKRLLIGGTAIVLVGAGAGTWFATNGSAAATPGITTTTKVQSVTTGTITQTVATTGTIEPANQANLNFAVSGVVTSVNVTAGQSVAAGQTLATDESTGASATQIALDNANSASAQTQVTAAQTNATNATLVSTISGTVASVDLATGHAVHAHLHPGAQRRLGGSGNIGWRHHNCHIR